MLQSFPAVQGDTLGLLTLWRTQQHASHTVQCQKARGSRAARREPPQHKFSRRIRKRGQAPCASLADPVSHEVEAGPDARYMRRALELAKRGLGQTYPNPAVGCVIVQGDEVVGEGYHPKAGEPHAEVFALRAAGQKAEGATAYVTLEPCNHYGRTPPCALALVEARVARVVVGVVDPNPLVGGQGIKTLEAAGIAVSSGIEEEACYAINEDFMQRMAVQVAEHS